MIDALLKVADILLGRRDKLREIDVDRRKRVSLYFENVSRCLADIATALRDSAEPWQACGELQEYSRDDWKDKDGPIVEVFGEDLALKVRVELIKLTDLRGGAVVVLSRVRSGEYLHVPFWYADPDQPAQAVLSEAIIKIEQTAGKFKALSVLASIHQTD